VAFSMTIKLVILNGMKSLALSGAEEAVKNLGHSND